MKKRKSLAAIHRELPKEHAWALALSLSDETLGDWMLSHIRVAAKINKRKTEFRQQSVKDVGGNVRQLIVSHLVAKLRKNALSVFQNKGYSKEEVASYIHTRYAKPYRKISA